MQDTKELDSLLAAINRSAERTQALWFAFLSILFYLAITASNTTHKSLLIEDEQILPILNIKIQVVGFYVVAPALFIIVHLYLLISIILLARTASEFNSQIEQFLPRAVDREPYRARVENSIFLQMLIGQRPERVGINSIIISFVALITTVVLPVLLLVLYQMEFLPYHSVAITWFHRILVLSDLLIALLFWAAFRGLGGDLVLSVKGGLSPTAGLFIILCIWLSVWEGRWFGEPLLGGNDNNLNEYRFLSHLFPSRLIISKGIVVNRDIWKAQRTANSSTGGRTGLVTIDLSNRNFIGAKFSNVDLRGVRFFGSDLRESTFYQVYAAFTDFSGAKMGRSIISDSDFSAAEFAGADLLESQFSNVEFSGSGFKGAVLDKAEMFRTTAIGSDFRYTSLFLFNSLQSNFDISDFKASCIFGSKFVETNMHGVDLSGATLVATLFQGVNIDLMNISGSIFDKADVRGVSGSVFRDSKTEVGDTACAAHIKQSDGISRKKIAEYLLSKLSSDKLWRNEEEENEIRRRVYMSEGSSLSAPQRRGGMNNINQMRYSDSEFYENIVLALWNGVCNSSVGENIDYGADYYARMLRIDTDNRAEENGPDNGRFIGEMRRRITSASANKGDCSNDKVGSKKVLKSLVQRIEHAKMRVDLMRSFDRTD